MFFPLFYERARVEIEEVPCNYLIRLCGSKFASLVVFS